jgi:methylated-DNA-[protein]-cysteine S-methyltransferase
MSVAQQTYETPVGWLRLNSNGKALTGLWFVDRPEASQGLDCPVIAQTRQELAAYFAGQRQHFTVPVAPQGTDFQRKVWAALLTIPYGQTRSYSQQATAIGQPAAVRAVGLANGRNPISILIPCHRVIGANGSLTGYGGGLDRKRFLLDLEQPKLL